MDLEALLDTFDPAQLFGPGFLQTLRTYLEHLEAQHQAAREATQAKEHGVDEDVSDDFLFAVFDQRHMTARPAIKWYDPHTQLGDRAGRSKRTLKKGVCVHHTAVAGGFGADKNLIRQYKRESEPFFDGTLWRVPPQSGEHGPIVEPTLDEWARAMALAHRYRGDPPRKYNYGVPYHAISAANSVLYLNLPFDWVTWHGNGSNIDFLGFAWDASSTREKPKPEDHQADLRYFIELARDDGHPIEELTVHAAWTRKPKDPGKDYIEQVMVPVADELGLVINWDFKANKKGTRSMGEIVGKAA